MKELKYQTNNTMRSKVEKLLKDVKKMQKEAKIEYRQAEHVFEEYHYSGMYEAFSKSAQLLTDILNSENPKDVSSQPGKKSI
jgi:hypothetical protein